MKRTMEEALNALQQKILSLQRGGSRANVSVFVYPPEWEAVMLARFSSFAQECEARGCPVGLVDLGQGLLTEIERHKGLEESLVGLETHNPVNLLHDLSIVAERYLKRIMKSSPEAPMICRLIVNTGALATLVSYSAIANELAGSPAGAEGGPLPCILAFPGDGDEKFLNLLRLRADTNYRAPRI